MDNFIKMKTKPNRVYEYLKGEVKCGFKHIYMSSLQNITGVSIYRVLGAVVTIGSESHGLISLIEASHHSLPYI